ncbi:MAG TPA: Gldg family protein [Acidobacteriota bacterium]|nr:Gldg family protein [Acidobacteriota bacterium]
MDFRINWDIVWALIKRDLRRYFSSPSGYVFITLFIFLSAAAGFWQEDFFRNNLANLDQLNEFFPYLLLFFVPALTMAVWSEERKQGTDELLLTLPATDLEVVLGKYVATLGVYTASLLLSFSHVLVLFWLGSPDLGLMFGNYLGFWLIGAGFIAVGMLASLLTDNATIAFILGAAFCSVFVFVGPVADAAWGWLSGILSPLGVFDPFSDFARGVISISGLFYFLSMTAVLLYANVLLIGRRHWPRQADGYPMWTHYLVRVAAIAVAVLSLNVMLGRAGLRIDVTAEQLHSLTGQTQRILRDLPDERPVLIQAYISPEVPESYVQARANLVSTLREVDEIAGGAVEVYIQSTEPFSQEAREAREKFGIAPRQVAALEGGRTSVSEIFMGVAFTSGPREQVISFFDRGLPAEYEIMRSIRVVADAERKRVGVVTTAVRLFGGMDFQTMRSQPPWSVVEELKKQYDVVEISAASPITQELDGLLVILPSSLPQNEMDNLLAYIETGVPTLLLVDPLPVSDISLAPSEQAGANRNPFMQNQPPPQPKGNITAFLSALGVNWQKSLIAWDTYNPHPDLSTLPPEVVFVGRGNGNPQAFNPDNAVTSRLQEVVLLYPGFVSGGSDDYQFTPLLQTGQQSGMVPYQEMVQRSFLGAQINPRPMRRRGPGAFTAAARVRSRSLVPDETNGEDEAGEDEGSVSADDSAEESRSEGTDVIVVADLDFVSEQFFRIRQAGPENLNFDNVTFFLNAMDSLLADESFIGLRSRRVEHRTLTAVEEQIRQFNDQRLAEEEAAQQEADQALAEAQQRLNEKVAEVRNRSDLDQQAKEFMARNLQEVESRKLEVTEANIEARREAQVRAAEEEMEAKIRRIQSNIRTFAVLLPPIPVLVLGVLIFLRRRRRENVGAVESRRLKEEQ